MTDNDKYLGMIEEIREVLKKDSEKNRELADLCKQLNELNEQYYKARDTLELQIKILKEELSPTSQEFIQAYDKLHNALLMEAGIIDDHK